ncbi:hypothetical protein [uncultured Paracoccus sp.]|nr:hypothetical protein [uncultured Paracoccus sp.]
MLTNLFQRRRRLPMSADALLDASAVARLLSARLRDGRGAALLRFGDTGGRVLARPAPGTPGYDYLQAFLGAEVTPRQIDWLGRAILHSAAAADIVGLRSDLLGPDLPAAVLAGPDEEVLGHLSRLYPIRSYELQRIKAPAARRLAETRLAMQRFPIRADAHLTNAWIHLDLARIGFFSALLREAPSVALITSAERKPVVRRMQEMMGPRLRFYECPAYPAAEAKFGGNHDFLWARWQTLYENIRPSRPGEPLLISAGIWTKPLATIFRRRGGVAVDFGSVLDYFAGLATRPAVLADRFGTPDVVPDDLTLDGQFKRSERLADFM